MAERKNTHGLKLTRKFGSVIVDIGKMEIWDGADLSLVRDTLNVLISRRRKRSVGIHMKYVKYVPSGFFGMLYDYFEAGITVRLVRPQPRVAEMLWFQRFFVEEAPGVYRLDDIYECGIDADINEDEAAVETLEPLFPMVRTLVEV